MNIYLAARYSRRSEMQAHAAQLRTAGHTVTSRWHEGDAHLATEEDLLGADQALAVRFASEDWDDLNAAELVISFTETPRGAANRGGRHVEYGIALGLGRIRVWVIGPRENVFHALAERQCATWGEALEALR